MVTSPSSMPRSIADEHPYRSPDFHRLPPVEKDADDTNQAPSASPSTERHMSTTFTTLSRLLGATSLSPEASRDSSYMNSVQQHGYIRNLNVKETAPLPDHLFNRGLCEGKHSDITVLAFNTRYKLHRIILDRAPFFATALSGPWLEAKSSEMTIHPEEIDSNITQHGFELALKRLYRGVPDVELEDRHSTELFATGCWLEMPDLIEASIESILRQMSTDTLGGLISIVTKNYYGRSGDKILASAKAMLCRDGWKMPSRHWDTIPADIVNEIVSSDGFYVHGEWERWVLAKKIVDRRLRSRAVELGLYDPVAKKTSVDKPHGVAAMRSLLTTDMAESVLPFVKIYADAEFVPLFDLLDHGIHYVHLEYEHLQHIRSACDVLGFLILPDIIISTALWQQLELRQLVLNSEEDKLELGLAVKVPETGETSHKASRPSGLRPLLRRKDKTLDSKAPAQDGEDHQDASGPRKHWIPSADCNIVMGGNSDPVISISSNDATRAPDNSDKRRRKDLGSEIKYPLSFSKLPPFRFSAEFPAPKLIKERKRAYSRTIFYAGSLWNIYVQKVHTVRSAKQLGVYLHRVKEKEIDDAVLQSTGTNPGINVEGRIGKLERNMIRAHRARQIAADQISHWEDEDSSADGNSNAATAGSKKTSSPKRAPFSSQCDMDVADAESDVDPEWHVSRSMRLESDYFVPVLPPYMDLRPTIKTYFKIFSPSRGGRMLSVYESAPDKFNFSQSWGWKSSTLMLDEGLLPSDENYMGLESTGEEEGAEEAESSNFSATFMKEEGNGKKTVKSLGDGKSRFMVVIGIL